MSTGQFILICVAFGGWIISSETARKSALRSEAFNTLNLIEKEIISIVNFAIDSWSTNKKLDFKSETFINSQLARIEVNTQFLKKYLTNLDVKIPLALFRGSLTLDLQYNDQEIQAKIAEISSGGDKVINEIRRNFMSMYLDK